MFRVMDPHTKLKLTEASKNVSDLQANLENVLDNSLVNGHIDVNRYIKLYNKYLMK